MSRAFTVYDPVGDFLAFAFLAAFLGAIVWLNVSILNDEVAERKAILARPDSVRIDLTKCQVYADGERAACPIEAKIERKSNI